ncbi:B12-binding domain-containing radical SAM protein [Actinomadura litoris]|uniref:Radical SAM protein n=1 Tax=Actinomadura litoris TaxID=2678616 RepID=A0A7K1KVX7_9ACTN|nr:radical SAM protein [Actinomadura litoris]MUN36351.1 radical SAM protein [Actinomadura litoris]
MRIAFLNPSVGFSDRRKSIPIGLAYIMAFLESRGYRSTGFDFGDSTTGASDLVEQYRLWDHDLLGMSVYNESFPIALDMAREVKRRNPGCFVVMGGPQATATHGRILRDHPEVDAVVRREGEHPTLDLVRCLESGPDGLGAVPNLTWREGAAVQVNAELPALDDLDSLPFPAADFVTDRAYARLHFYDALRDELRPALTINTSRSCPYNCSFCGVLTIGRRYRSRSPGNVVEELEFFRERDDVDYRHVYFSDANFFVQAGRALEIVRALHAADDRVTFSFGTRVNQILKAQHAIMEMRALGLRFIEVGVESASPAVLRRLAKGVGPEVNDAAVAFLNRIGVEIALDFIMVDPASTVEDLRLNMDFIERHFLDHYPHEHFYTSLALYEGTPIREYYEERLGRPFAAGTLPDTAELFEHAELRVWWNLLWSFGSRYQGRIDALLAKTETLLKHPAAVKCLTERQGPWEDLSRLQLDSVTLRHAPPMFFRRLVDRLASGALPATLEEVGLRGFGRRGTDLDDVIASATAALGRLGDRLGLPPGELDRALQVSGAAYQ